MPKFLFRHEFVDAIPENLSEQTLYISIPFKLAMHKCACGCGNEVATPLSPHDWAFTYNGSTVSMAPSIGNWGFACQSHYWLKRDTVKWAAKMSAREIEDNRRWDRASRMQQPVTRDSKVNNDKRAVEEAKGKVSWLRSLVSKLFSGRNF